MRPWTVVRMTAFVLGAALTLTLGASGSEELALGNSLPARAMLWHGYTDGNSTLDVQSPSAFGSNEAGMALSMQWTLQPGNATPYAGVQTLLNPDGRSADLTPFAGLRFYARGKGSCQIVLPLEATRKDYNHFQTALVLTPEWRLYEFPFTSFLQSWGKPQVWNPATVYALQIDAGSKTGSLELRQVEFFAAGKSRSDFKRGRIFKRPKINQVGYLPQSEKRFSVVSTTAKEGDLFTLADASGNTVYTGRVSGPLLDNTREAGETLFRGDFSDWQTPGQYTLLLNGTKSQTFQIADGCYLPLFQDALHAFSLIRCGTAVADAATGIRHPACHLQDAVLRNQPEKRGDFTGGWHNAGDYGKWCHMHAMTLAYFLWLYELMPAAEAKYRSALLAESVWGLQFLLKLQYPDGSVYHKVDTEPNFCFGTPPDQDPHVRQVAFQSVTRAQKPSAVDAGMFTAIMAQAARVLDETDPALASACRRAALRSWTWLQRHPATGQTDPYYTDNDARQEIFWAQVELFRLTGDEALEKDLKAGLEQTPLRPVNWQSPQAFGYISLAVFSKTSSALKEKIISALQSQCDDLVKTARQSGYGVTLGPDQYYWESNETVLHQANLLLFGYLILHSQNYLFTASHQLDYLLGENALDQSFITGYGARRVLQPYHWTYAAYGKIMPGWVVGGPNGNAFGADAPLRALIALGTPPAKCYLDLCDNTGSYASNEGETSANAALVFLTGFLSFPPTP